MIKLQIDGDKYDLPSDLRSQIEESIGGLDEYMNTLESGHVTVAWDGGTNKRTKIHAQLWGPGHTFEGHDTDWHPSTALHKTRHKLETQIRREHGKEISERDEGGRKR